MRYSLLAAAALLLSTLAAAAQAPDEPGAKLPPGEGRELVMKTCSKCHTPDIVAGQTLDEQGWKELVDQMAGNGAQGSDDDFANIVAYLAKAFPAR